MPSTVPTTSCTAPTTAADLLSPPTPPTTFRSTSSSLSSTAPSLPPVHAHPTELTPTSTSRSLTVTSSGSASGNGPPALHLFTTSRGRIHSFHQDMFTPHSHRVIGCTEPPPTLLALGMRVVVEGATKATGTLTRVYGVEDGRVLLVLQPDDQDRLYLVLRIHPQYAKLSRYWRMRMNLYQWTHWWK
jgi:hypothetical protein